MTARMARNLIAVLIVVLILALMVVLGGCTRYHVIKGQPGSDTYTEISVWSNRDFEAPDLNYQRDPDGVRFSFGADSINGQSSPFEAIGAIAVQRLLDEIVPPTTKDGDN